jgi:hypothetical protein
VSNQYLALFNIIMLEYNEEDYFLPYVGEQLDVLQREQQRPGEQMVGRVGEARQEPFRDGQVPFFL